VSVRFGEHFEADLIVHIHPPDRALLKTTSLGELHADHVVLAASLLAGKTQADLEIE